MLLVAWVLSLIAAFYLGYFIRSFKNKIEFLEEQVKSKIDKPKEEPKSFLYDPLDPVQQAMLDQEALMKKLNNG